MTIARRTRSIAVAGILSALSIVLSFLELPIPFLFPDFLKIDISDVPALLGAFALGPLAGLGIEVIKNLAHLLKSSSGGIGELANMVVGGVFVIVAGIIYQSRKNRFGAYIGMGAGILSMTTVACLANYFFLIPLYTGSSMKLGAILVLFVPFNLFKGLVVSLLTGLIYKRISPLLHGEAGRR